MCSGNVLSFDTQPKPASKACSGKCASGTCGGAAAPRVWVVAACEGMISLYEKSAAGELTLILQGDGAVATSVEGFSKHMARCAKEHAFARLVLVGSAGDIAWLHSSLPDAAEMRIAAEIEYPLVARWFTQGPQMGQLTNALKVLLFQ